MPDPNVGIGFQPTYYMDVGDLAMQALMSVLIGAMVYLWFLASFIIPNSQTIFDIEEKLDYGYNIEEITPP